VSAFRARNVCVARYGQKANLSAQVRQNLEQLSKKFATSIALAAEVSLADSFLALSSANQNLSNCFSNLFSAKAVNLELKQPACMNCIPNTHRLVLFYLRVVVYNTLQHVKRLGSKRLSLVWTKENSISSSLKASLLKSLQFVLTQVLPKISSSKLRIEAYVMLGSHFISDIQESVKKYVLAAPILQEDSQKVSLYARNMCQIMIQAHDIFIDNTFSDFFVCFSLYRQLVSGIYCSERISRKWLQERPVFGLQRKIFLFPRVRVNLALLDFADLERNRKVLEDIFGPEMWNIFLLLFLKEAVEADFDLGKCGTVIKEASENLEIILAKFFPASQTDGEACYTDLKSLLEKQLTVHCSFEKSLTCHLLLLIWSNNECFDALTGPAAKLSLSLKINQKTYVYIPCNTLCDISSLQRLVNFFTLEQCRREIQHQYIVAEGERFKGLEALFRDATQAASKIHHTYKLPGKIEMMDLDAFLRCVFATFAVDSKEHLFQIVRNIDAFKKFMAIVTLYYNILKVFFVYL
jgi:hypothetical protein